MSSMSKRYKMSSEFLMSRQRRITTDILRFSLFAATLAILNHAVIHGIKLEQAILAFLLIFALSAGPMLVFSMILLRRTRSTRLLEEAVVRAIYQALDESSLNPHSVKTEHEQHTNQTSTEPR